MVHLEVLTAKMSNKKVLIFGIMYACVVHNTIGDAAHSVVISKIY